jgi:hypothetical protein
LENPTYAYEYKVEYKVVIYIKDNKYKIEIIPLDYVFVKYYEKYVYNRCLNHFNMLKLDITRFVNGEICDDF